jgi:SAM-dependent methyltransferase
MRVVHPLPTESDILGLYSPAYFEGGGHGYRSYLDDDEIHRRFAQKRLATLRKHVATGCILDVGCAAGFFLEEARQIGFTVRGVEVCGEMAELARERFSLEVETGELSTSRAAAGSVDVVTFFNVLAHVPDPLAALRKAYELLRPGGMLVIETWNADGLASRLLGRHWPLYNPPSVLFYLGSRSLPRLLDRAGFEVVASQGGSKTISIREAASMLRNHFSGGLFKPLDLLISRRFPGAGVRIPLGMGQLITVFARRRESSD